MWENYPFGIVYVHRKDSLTLFLGTEINVIFTSKPHLEGRAEDISDILTLIYIINKNNNHSCYYKSLKIIVVNFSL